MHRYVALAMAACYLQEDCTHGPTCTIHIATVLCMHACCSCTYVCRHQQICSCTAICMVVCICYVQLTVMVRCEMVCVVSSNVITLNIIILDVHNHVIMLKALNLSIQTLNYVLSITTSWGVASGHRHKYISLHTLHFCKCSPLPGNNDH